MSAAVDPREVLAGLGVADPTDISPVTGGFGGNSIWRVEVAGPPPRTYALRLFGVGDERTYGRELAAMQTVQGQGVPMPEVRAAAIQDGRPVMLLDWCPGRTMMEELARHPERAWALGMTMGTAHGHVHLCRFGPELLERGNNWIAWTGPDEDALQERLRAVSERDDARPGVLHLDMHPANVLMRGGRVTGIIDWANAGAGDIRADVARTSTILRFSPVPPAMPRTQILRLRRLFRRGWRLGHRRVIGDLREMELFDAWALAVMVRDLGAKLAWPDPSTAGVTEADLVPIRRALARRKGRLGLE